MSKMFSRKKKKDGKKKKGKKGKSGKKVKNDVESPSGSPTAASEFDFGGDLDYDSGVDELKVTVPDIDLSDLDDFEKTAIKPMKSFDIHDENFADDIREQFSKFEELLMDRKFACLDLAKQHQQSDETETKEKEKKKSKKKQKKQRIKHLIYIDSEYVCETINNIGNISDDHSENIYNYRLLTSELIDNLREISIYQEKMDTFKEELTNIRTNLLPKIFKDIRIINNEINEIKEELAKDLDSSKNDLKFLIERSSLDEIRSLKNPHNLLVKTIKACAIVIGEISVHGDDLSNNENRSINAIQKENDDDNSPVSPDENDRIDKNSRRKTWSSRGRKKSRGNALSPVDANGRLSVRHVSSTSNFSFEFSDHSWTNIRKLLKPQFIDKLVKFDAKNLGNDIKDILLRDYINLGLFFDDPNDGKQTENTTKDNKNNNNNNNTNDKKSESKNKNDENKEEEKTGYPSDIIAVAGSNGVVGIDKVDFAEDSNVSRSQSLRSPPMTLSAISSSKSTTGDEFLTYTSVNKVNRVAGYLAKWLYHQLKYASRVVPKLETKDGKLLQLRIERTRCKLRHGKLEGAIGAIIKKQERCNRQVVAVILPQIVEIEKKTDKSRIVTKEEVDAILLEAEESKTRKNVNGANINNMLSSVFSDDYGASYSYW